MDCPGRNRCTALAAARRNGVTVADGPIGVLVLHDHPLLVDGLRAALDPFADIDVVADTGDESQAVALVHEGEIEVAVVENAYGQGAGIEAGRRLIDERPSLKVLLLTGYGDHEHLAARAVELGFAGVIPRRSSVADLAQAVRQVHIGNSAFSPNDLAHALRRARSARASGTARLSDREQQVLLLISQGVPTEKIATELGVTVHTVRGHVRKILSKLGVHSKAEAVNVGHRFGLLHGG